jgi:glutathione S-transferase
VLVGRSSSHFTRTTRIFAHELGVPFTFRPVFDMTSLDAAAYGDNPALKVPVLCDEEGPLFGAENICRALVARAGARDRVVMRGDLSSRVVANAEEMILHAMSAEVILITAQGEPHLGLGKVRTGLLNALTFLEAHVDAMLASLPVERALSFCEVALYCLITHLPFRQILDVSDRPRLQAFATTFSSREGARATPYCFDVPPNETA